MKVATFYPSSFGVIGAINTYDGTLRAIELGLELHTKQMCMLDRVKDYDLIRIVNGKDVIEIKNNHDGTYSCDRTQRMLRRGHNFFKLWENGEFDI